MLQLTARAKVNLTLRITGKRGDGYHELQSLICFPATGDQLEIAEAEEISLELDGPFAFALGPENLVLRAAEALRAQAGITRGARLRLTKRLPVAAGIGGGSADAAATLKGLARLWEIPEGAVDLPALALSLGADVPVCLFEKPCLVTGIGENLEVLAPLPSLSMVLVNPGRALSTAAVFAAHWEDFSSPEDWADLSATATDFLARLAASTNDLEAAACRLLPEIDEVLACLWAVPGCRLSRMSGSGATCFGLFTEPDAAREAASRLASEAPGWWVAAAPLDDAEVPQ
jgi:4-diphosphocytidyl-2-C-methyl-D-erythritol kinase